MAGRSRPVVGAGRAAGLGETWPVAGPVACLPCPTLSVKGAAHRLRRQPRAAALDPEPSSARRVAGAGRHGPAPANGHQ